ncbi:MULTISPECIES: hypothetical protein [Latilactobacillus]|uniref:hypothetical protein n=1 Tax=Latilactobacillus TaxID=2767885 RepID=UPI0020A5E518|nr:hypothetical protein [Latilactobacillus curvatus]
MSRKEKIKAILEVDPERKESLLQTLSDATLNRIIFINKKLIERQLEETYLEMVN